METQTPRERGFVRYALIAALILSVLGAVVVWYFFYKVDARTQPESSRVTIDSAMIDTDTIPDPKMGIKDGY